MSFNLTKSHIDSWRKPGPESFWNWCRDIKPRILTRSGKYEVFHATDLQKEAVEGILDPQTQIAALCWPRRHGKSTIYALLLLWMLTTKQNWTCGLLGASETHSRRTQYNLILRIIRNTPLLNDSIPEADTLRYEITFRPLSSVIQLQQMNISTSFGEKISVLWCSDIHSYQDLSAYFALQASLLDSEGSKIYIDANVDTRHGVVHNLELESQKDPGIFFSRVKYRSMADYEKRAPQWIDRGRAQRLVKTTLETDYRRDLLGQRSSLKNSLFSAATIKKCQDTYKIPVVDIQAITKGRAYRVSGGLDRARSLFQSKRSDATVWTSVLKCSDPEHGEPLFFILNQKKINPNHSRLIKRAILKDHRRYHFNNVALENHETADLAPWLSDQNIDFELVNPMQQLQNTTFVELYRIASEGRLRLPANADDLISEMRVFQYKQGGGQKYQFKAAGSAHDDFIFSLNWAIYALRSEVLDLYQIRNIQCLSKSIHRSRCFLMDGNLILFCSQSCESFQKVEQMFQQYKGYNFDSALTLQEFFQSKTKLTGARVREAI